MSTSIVAGSLAALAQRQNVGVACLFADATHVVVVDVSGSMANADSRGGRRRIDVAREELAKLQAQHPGRLAIIGFSERARFLPGGVVPEAETNTDLAGALGYARRVDGTGLALVVITDGQPDDATAALAEAQRFTCRIDVVFVGDEADAGAQLFCKLLARSGRGTASQAFRVGGMAEAVTPLLSAGASR